MVSPVLASVLASRRSLFNQRVAQARQRWPALDVTAFGGFITQTLDPLCAAVAAVDAARMPLVAEVGFDTGLELVAQGLAGPGARLPWVDRAWQQLAAPAATLIASAPRETLASIGNAVVQMGNTPGARVGEWITHMTSLASRCDSLAALQSVGALCAWQSGMVHLRSAALLNATGLPEVLAAAACGVAPDHWTSVRTRLAADRWWKPSSQSVDLQGQWLGGFSGLGGPFPCPPQLRASDNGFIARCGERYFLLIADAFGAVVLPASAAEFSHAREGVAPCVTLDAQGGCVGKVRITFAAPADRLAAVSGPAGVAFFSPWSHHVRIVPEGA